MIDPPLFVYSIYCGSDDTVALKKKQPKLLSNYRGYFLYPGAPAHADETNQRCAKKPERGWYGHRRNV
jgi:hypothetical protein